MLHCCVALDTCHPIADHDLRKEEKLAVFPWDSALYGSLIPTKMVRLNCSPTRQRHNAEAANS